MRNGNTTSLQDDLGGVTPGSYPTYEEWKQYICQKVETIEKTFLSYLWGMETGEVYTLFPLHNSGSYPTYEEWKHVRSWYKWDSLIYSGSYPTYEEWKLISLSLVSNKSLYVLILPMRNGNDKEEREYGLNYLFLSYLWGMETSYIPGWVSCSHFLFLSYLWGMETWTRITENF